MSRIITFEKRVELPVSREEAFAWHERPGTFRRLLPPWENVVGDPEPLREDLTVELKVQIGPKQLDFVVHHDVCRPPELFRDVQQQGPFASWVHEHRFHELPGENGSRCELHDHIEYELPLGAMGKLLGQSFAQGNLRRMFAWRHRITRDDLALHSSFKDLPAMKVAISGSTGLVGSELIDMLTTGGHETVSIVRKDPGENDILWKPREGAIQADKLEGVDAVVHLAGENIAGKRWNDEQKARIRKSRVEGTKVLCEALAKLSNKPRVLVCASAVGFYGDRGDEVLTEESEAGQGFLADVCKEWEAATKPASDAGIRVVFVRFGIVLSGKGGALKEMLPIFKWGLGGKLGSGDQYWSWVALDDACGAIVHALQNENVSGPVNIVTPDPPTNKEFTNVVGKVLGRPTFMFVPTFGLRMMVGEMADALLLASLRVEPKVLEETGYQFRFTDLEDALRHLLGRTKEG